MTVNKGSKNTPTLFAIFFAALFLPHLLYATTQKGTPDEVASKYLEYYFLFQDAKKHEDNSDFSQAAVTYDRARTLLSEIQALDPTWRPAFINVKLREIQSAINLMEYRKMIQDAENFLHLNQAARAKEAYEKARTLLQEIKHNDPGWREEVIALELRRVEEKMIAQNQDTKISSPISSEKSKQENNFLPRVSLPEEMSPLPRAISNFQQPAADVPNNELQKAQSLLAETKATLAIITRERDELKERLETQNISQQKEIQELREKNTNLSQALAATTDRLRSSEEEIKRIKQLRIEETIQTLNIQLAEARAALEDATLKTQAYEKETASLRARLQRMEQQLASQPENQITEKNREAEVLNEILARLNSEKQRREQAREAALAEISRLKIQSSELLKQLDILGAPILSETTAQNPNDDAPIQQTTALANANPPSSAHQLPSTNSPRQRQNTTNSTQQKTASSESPSAPSNKSDLPDSVASLADEADRLFSEGKFEEAAAKYELILERYPDSSYALANYGVICQQLGRTRTALAALERAVEISPNDAFALNMLGIIHCILGQNNPSHYQKAFDLLTRAARIDPENALIRNYLGISAFNINKPEVAERELRRAIEIRSDYPVAHINLAVIYANQKPPALEMARRHYIRAIQLGHPRHIPTEEKLKISETDLPRTAVTRAG